MIPGIPSHDLLAYGSDSYATDPLTPTCQMPVFAPAMDYEVVLAGEGRFARGGIYKLANGVLVESWTYRADAQATVTCSVPCWLGACRLLPADEYNDAYASVSNFLSMVAEETPPAR